ncbi:DUF4240 domain-containing protein [Nonomuraea sp. SYSU D8015]|uniref:DUF4240 domain-containing protein n=1 Tax=Nonomuraea sp. SYSU D8015 TaxID=2593644 RepID=UPI0016606C20|nr:DUF4240 domain-containing protein [Nonomuraea sp. SYSU D8015]
MTRDDFWAILAECPRPTGPDDDCDELVSRLSRLPPQEIVAFDQHLTDLRLGAHRVDLWGAAYLINGGCSDDGFEYFRCWLVGQGREIYEAALADPDSLADYGPVRRCILDDFEECECEVFMYTPDRAYQRMTGHELPEGSGVYPELGEMWDFADVEEMRRRYPRLSALLDEADALP